MSDLEKFETPQAYLDHAGVKGMKWGVRKANPSITEIVSARKRQTERAKRFAKAKTSGERSSAKRDFETSEDRVTAARMTMGEKITAGILTGPLALVVISANKGTVRRVAARTDAARKKA